MDNLEQHREDWEEDISLEDAMKEVQRAKARMNTKKKMQDFAKALDARTQTERWRKMYEFLANYNPAARRDFDLFNADCQRIKQEQKQWNAKGKHIQYGLHMPQILWDALAIVDPEIRDFNSLDKEHQRRIYRKLGQAFPIYWMPRVQSGKIDFTTLSGNYSTTEIDTGYTWLNGEKVYKKSVIFGYLPNTGTKTMPHGITHLKYCIDIIGVATKGDYSAQLKLPWVAGSSTNAVSLGIINDSIQIQTGGDRSDMSCIVTILYTKTS